MNTEKLIAQSYILTEDNVEQNIEYYIYSSEKENNICEYGIRVKQTNEDSVISESAIVCEDEETVINLIHSFAKNFVFPVSLNELISDFEKE